MSEAFDSILANEHTFRLSVFVGVLLLMSLLEQLIPFRASHPRRLWRWMNNIGLSFLSGLFIRLVFSLFFPLMAVGAALIASENNWGLLSLPFFQALPHGFVICIAILLLDLAIYWQHRIVHHVPLLWRLHKVHHIDPDFDASTAVRFHPIEILISMGLKVGIVFLIGAPALSVILFEVILNASAIFNHSNIRLPSSWDRIIRKIIVTPNMHRIHHSTLEEETNSNYGFFFSFWDRWFFSYKDAAHQPLEQLKMGLSEFRSEKYFAIFQLIVIPFRRGEKP